MPRYIDADLIPYKEVEWACDDYTSRYDIEEIPTADVVEVVHSEWHTDAVRMNSVIATCRNCHKTEEIHITNCFEYCPHCGAKMDVED